MDTLLLALCLRWTPVPRPSLPGDNSNQCVNVVQTVLER